MQRISRVVVAGVVAALVALGANAPSAAAARKNNHGQNRPTTTTTSTTSTTSTTTPTPAPTPCRNGYVSLSFDDGPTSLTPTLLDTLARHNLRGAFFDVGERAELYPGYVVMQRNAGHQIGNHSYNHPDLTKVSAAELAAQLDVTQQILTPLAGYAPTFMRPPYGAINDNVAAAAAARNLTPVIWTIDTVDWSGVSAQAIATEALKVQPGGFVLMHDGYASTIAAIPAIAQGLADRGLCAGRMVASTTPTNAWYGLDFNATVVAW